VSLAGGSTARNACEAARVSPFLRHHQTPNTAHSTHLPIYHHNHNKTNPTNASDPVLPAQPVLPLPGETVDSKKDRESSFIHSSIRSPFDPLSEWPVPLHHECTLPSPSATNFPLPLPLPSPRLPSPYFPFLLFESRDAIPQNQTNMSQYGLVVYSHLPHCNRSPHSTAFLKQWNGSTYDLKYNDGEIEEQMLTFAAF
jgi:hypothetical protein